MRRPRALLAAVLLLPLLVAAPVIAQDPGPGPAQGVNVTPDPQSPRRSAAGTLAELGVVVPGQPVVDGVLVRSSFDEPREVVLHAADALPAVGGGFGFRGAREQQSEVGRWLVLERTRLTVPADGQVLVPYTLVVPPGTPGGEYVGAVVAEAVTPGGTGVTSRTRFAMAVYLRVPAPPGTPPAGRGSPDGRLVVEGVDPRFDGERACPVVRYRNDSQDVVDPVATVRTDGVVGGTTRRVERAGALLPGTRAEVPLPCVERPLGRGRLVVELESPRGGGSAAVAYTWAPAPLVLSLLLLLLLLAALLATLLSGLRRRTEQGDSAGGA